MATATLRPNAASSFASDWSVVGAATAWQALRDQSALTYCTASSPGQAARVRFQSLPAEATAVSSLTLWGRLYQDTFEEIASQVFLGVLAPSELDASGAAFAPSDAGATNYSAALSNPDGGDWTVEAVNAITGQVAVYDYGAVVYAEELWLVVEYTVPAADPPLPYADVRFPDNLTVDVAFPKSAEVSFPDPADAEIPFPGNAEVSFPDPADAEIPVTPKSG